MVQGNLNGRDEMGILVRATVNLPGLAAGQRAMVDPQRYSIARLLNAEYLVPIESWERDGQADATGVPIHGSILEEGTEVQGTDGDSAQASDVPDGLPPVDTVL